MASNDSLSTPDVRIVTPTDAQIRFQFYFIRSQHLLKPLGFQKMLDALKAEEPTWILGPGRLKRLLKAIAEEEAKEEKEREAAGPYIKLTAGHSQALRDQIAWQDKSIRHYRIIGHDGYDYASTPNSDMGILLNIMQKRATEEPELRAHALYTMWEHLEPAATKAGVPLENLRAQLTEEYGMDPLTAAPPPPRNDAERAARTAAIERRKAEHKREKMGMMRKMRDMGVPIPLDPRTGDVAWDDAKHGEFVVLVTRVDKETGSKELESW
ncbi:hypothetical protein DFH08DRAFT_263284 [Mycena albidolilacea]|uniref:Uncharacterized protein n=1 Tax=Mycena albidolilacea TaxID=1033008 RepID=A0AAD7AP15_9AGAR|nr:hypothetical protein DFH08DRAFT_263284 [Mycena albidolilacea]